MDVRDCVIAKTLAHSICRELVQVAFMVVTQLQGSASGTFRLRWSAASARFSLVRCRTAPECAFPSRRGAQEVWGNPPARLRGTMENASTGQMRSSNPPPGCGAGCAGIRRSRLGVWSHGKVHSAQPVGSRMRFSVRPHTQSALFCETAPRLPSSGKAHSTERRILCRRPHGKAHPRPATSIASKIVVYGRREKKTIAYPRMSVRPRND